MNNTTRRNDDSAAHAENGENETTNESTGQTRNGGLPIFQMTAPDGTTVEVPTDRAIYMVAISKKIDSFNESIREIASRTPHLATNSTRMDATADRRVTFENTSARQDQDRHGPPRQQALPPHTGAERFKTT